MPWSSDVPGATSGLNLSCYAHMCRVRRIHAKILCTMQTIAPEARAGFTKATRAEIDQWSQDGQVYGYRQGWALRWQDKARWHLSSLANTEGYASSLGLTHVAAITWVMFYRLDPDDINSPYTDEYLQSCCDHGGIFRSLQKKRQIPKHWLDVNFPLKSPLVCGFPTESFPNRCYSIFRSA